MLITPDSATLNATLLDAASAFSEFFIKLTLYLFTCVSLQSNASTYSELLGISI